jgi:hypothetical protein
MTDQCPYSFPIRELLFKGQTISANIPELLHIPNVSVIKHNTIRITPLTTKSLSKLLSYVNHRKYPNKIK